MSNLVSRRIDTSNKLRWLESDSSSEDEEAKKPPPPPKAEEEKNPFSSSFTAPPPQQHQLEVPDNFLEESPNASQESDKAKDPKKKKKKVRTLINFGFFKRVWVKHVYSAIQLASTA